MVTADGPDGSQAPAEVRRILAGQVKNHLVHNCYTVIEPGPTPSPAGPGKSTPCTADRTDGTITLDISLQSSAGKGRSQDCTASLRVLSQGRTCDNRDLGISLVREQEARAASCEEAGIRAALLAGDELGRAITAALRGEALPPPCLDRTPRSAPAARSAPGNPVTTPRRYQAPRVRLPAPAPCPELPRPSLPPGRGFD